MKFTVTTDRLVGYDAGDVIDEADMVGVSVAALVRSKLIVPVPPKPSKAKAVEPAEEPTVEGDDV